ncbi:MAG: hypothetical protein ACR2OU_20920 [Thermomicrobiales bacterium]
MAGPSQTQSTGQHDAIDAVADLGEAVTDAKEQIQEQVGSLTDQVRRQATEQFTTQTHSMTDDHTELRR